MTQSKMWRKAKVMALEKHLTPFNAESAMQFKMTHNYFPDEPQRFTEATAPDWLTGTNTRAGSTMDSRWFWVRHCLTLQIGESAHTDFRTITRTS